MRALRANIWSSLFSIFFLSCEFSVTILSLVLRSTRFTSSGTLFKDGTFTSLSSYWPVSSVSSLAVASRRLAAQRARRNEHNRNRPARMEATSSSLSTASTAVTLDIPLDIPAIDTREYHQLILPNGIAATLVHDSTSEKSSAALAVKVGAASDPVPGIAHITEHAVFLGSKKYPIENAYKNFLNKNGGGSNAGTGMEMTTYKFNINANAFRGALDIFSQFFKGPLFDDDAITREVMAVDAEDSKNRILDSRRTLQVLKDQITPHSSYSKFSTGNVKTLANNDAARYGPELAATIRAFHSEHYRPEKMALTLVGPQSIDELQALAHEMFADIVAIEQTKANTSIYSADPASISASGEALESVVGSVVESETSPDSVGSNTIRSSSVVENGDEIASNALDTGRAGDAGTMTSDAALFKSGGGKLIRIKPVNEIRDLSIIWQLPPTRQIYRANPATLMGFLLGHKGPGSLFAALQDKGWATATSAGMRTTFFDFALFEVSVSLTEEGLERYDDVAKMVYEYVTLLQTASEDRLRGYWREIREQNAIDFQYQEKSTAYQLAPHLASTMLDYPLQHVLSAGWLLDETFPAALYREFVSKLTRGNSVVMMRSRSFDWIADDDRDHVKDTEQQQQQQHHQQPSGVNDNGGGNSQRAIRDRGETIIEPFYGVPYEMVDYVPSTGSSEKTDPIDANDASGLLHLPEENPFICSDLLLENPAAATVPAGDAPTRPLRSTPPVQLTLRHLDTEKKGMRNRGNGKDTPAEESPVAVTRQQVEQQQREEWQGRGLGRARTAVWHSKDEVFRQPRSVVTCLVYSPSCVDSHPVLSLLNSVFSQITARKYYPSAIAGLNAGFGTQKSGIGLSFYGYTSNLPELAKEVVRDVTNATFWQNVDEDVFRNCLDRLTRSLRSYMKDRPDTQADNMLSYLLQEGAWLPNERLAAAESITLPYFTQRALLALHLTPDTVAATTAATTPTAADAVFDAADATAAAPSSLDSMGVSISTTTTTTTTTTRAAESGAKTQQTAGKETGAERKIPHVLTYVHGDMSRENVYAFHETVTQGFSSSLSPTVGASDATTTNTTTTTTTAAAAGSLDTVAGIQGVKKDTTEKEGEGQKAAAQQEGTIPQQVGGEWLNRARVLAPGEHHVVALPALNAAEDPNSALVTHIQFASASPRLSALLLFLRRLLGEPAFTELRTKKQLGYIVSLSPGGYGRASRSMRGITIRILSNRFSPIAMQREVGAFLARQSELAEETLTDEEVRTRCESIIQSIQDPPTTYSEEADEFWDAILLEMPFNWTDLIIAELRQLSRADILRAFNDWIRPALRDADTGKEGDRENSPEIMGKTATNAVETAENEKREGKGMGRRSISVMMFGKDHIAELDALKCAVRDNTQSTHSLLRPVSSGGSDSAAVVVDTDASSVVASAAAVDFDGTDGFFPSMSDSKLYFSTEEMTKLRNQLPFCD